MIERGSQRKSSGAIAHELGSLLASVAGTSLMCCLRTKAGAVTSRNLQSNEGRSKHSASVTGTVATERREGRSPQSRSKVSR